MTNQNFHGGIEVSFKEPQGTEISNIDGPRLLLQKDLKAGFPAGKGVAMFKGHFCDQGMEFGYAGQSTLALLAIMETRLGG